MARYRVWPFGALALSAAIAPGCAPTITRFTVTPSHVCAGTPVTLDARVTGTPTLTIEPPLREQPGHIYVPEATTHFVISVKRWPNKKPKGSEAEVRVFPGQPDEVTAKVRCENGVVSGTQRRDPTEWDPRLQVTVVESGEDREVTVTHAGRTARLTPQARATSAFEGTSPGGDWTISSPLRAGETCDAAEAGPANLNVSAEVRCGS
jgi:hypothetical protein